MRKYLNGCPWIWEFLLFFVVLGSSLAFLIRYQILNGFSILPGDRYDGVISTVILEHWFRVFTEGVSWLEVGYFFPYERTIAQTDAYFLIGVAYIPFRLFGLDPFISSECAGLVIKAVGFLGFYLFCKKFLLVSPMWSLFGALLFTLSNGMTIHANRIQLATVAFAPVMALLIGLAVHAFFDRKYSRFRLWGAVSGVFFGAWCLTCFYMAWFFTFLATVFFVVLLLTMGKSALLDLTRKALDGVWSVVFVILSIALSISPFVYAFLPKSQEVGVRSFEAVVNNTVPLEGILQVGGDNFLLGRLYNSIIRFFSPSYVPVGEYYNTGFSVFLMALFIGGCWAIFKLKWADVSRFSLALVASVLICWALVLNFNGYSGWYFVYHAFPGAKALNAVSTFQIMLAFPVVAVAIKYLSGQQLSLPVLSVVLGVLVAGEINRPYMNLDRKAELDRVYLSEPAPAECRVFYVSGWEGQDNATSHADWVNNFYAHNVSAMFISKLYGVPTVNGVASFNPPDWNFGFPNLDGYDARVLEYAAKHGVNDLCRLDLNSKRWTLVM